MNQSSTRETLRQKNPYKRGADDGVVMGVILIAMFLSLTFATTSTLAFFIALLLIVAGVPAATFIMLRRSYVKDGGMTLFSSLWMQGIAMFFCATLLLAMFVYIYLRFMNPGYMAGLFNQAAVYYESLGTVQGTQMAKACHEMVHQNLIPSAISMAVETIWVGVFTGSLLSALMAGIVRLKIFRIN